MVDRPDQADRSSAAAIAVISCHRGFHSEPGAEGVGRAATGRSWPRSSPSWSSTSSWPCSSTTCTTSSGRQRRKRDLTVTPQRPRRMPTTAAPAPDLAAAGVDAVRRPARCCTPSTWTCTRGQTLAVIGESGCGKTVLLKLIIGLLRPTAGRVLFDGKVLADLPERELTRQRLRFGFLFQGAALFDSLTVYDNVAFGLRAQGRPEAEIREIVRQRLAGGRPAAGVDAEEAGRAVRRHEEAGWPGPGAGPRPGSHALRRTDHRPRPDHDRRDQRVDPADAAAAGR